MNYGYKFAYRNYTFIGVNKFNNKFDFGKILKYLHQTDLEDIKSNYSHEDFYKRFKTTNDDIKLEDYPDIFKCLETGNLYIPGNDSIFIIKKLDKLKRMLIG